MNGANVRSDRHLVEFTVIASETRKTGRLAAEAPAVTLGDDSPVRTRFVGVGAQGLVGFEVLVAFDREAQGTAQVANFVHAHVAKLWRAHAKVTEAEGDIVKSELRE